MYSSMALVSSQENDYMEGSQVQCVGSLVALLLLNHLTEVQLTGGTHNVLSCTWVFHGHGDICNALRYV